MQDVPQFDLYGTLGVPVGASRDEIEAAFRAAAMRDHPDTSADPSGATRRMQRLNIAREWLADPERRGRYDRARGLGAPTALMPEIDPLGPWPGAGDPSPADRATPASVVPAVALISLMMLLGLLVVGIGDSLVTIAAFALALTLFAYTGLMTLLGWFR